MSNDYSLAKRYINKIQSCNTYSTPFELTIGQFSKLYKRKTCYYTGLPLSLDYEKPNFLTLDRIDNSLGYTESNTVACCKEFNAIKAIWENPENNLTQQNVLKGLKILEKVNA